MKVQSTRSKRTLRELILQICAVVSIYRVRPQDVEISKVLGHTAVRKLINKHEWSLGARLGATLNVRPGKVFTLMSFH